jgi:hypothetical protein
MLPKPAVALIVPAPAVPARGIGYTATGATNGLRPNTGMLPYRGTSAGGGYSTVGDLLSFVNAVQQNKLLNAHYTEMLTVGKVKKSGGLPCGVGFRGLPDQWRQVFRRRCWLNRNEC